METKDFSAVPLIDRDQFDMLVETGEDEAAEMLQELLDLFLDEAKPKQEELRTVASEGDKDAIAKLAHSIAGSSGNLGGLRLSTAARDLENNIESVPEADLPNRAAQIKAIFEETVGVYQAEIDKLKS